ncbi:hypothetical protein [Peribacillus sp. NPDC056705]|uniref:hypothetical protein n=1 Tax=Peribacillus sp. NPDC056705 TaxID=3345918 RepID=UPI00374968E5
MENIKQKLFNSDVGVWLGVVSVVCYASYYIYATSFNQYYGLPSNLVELKIENVAIVIAYGIFIISIFFVIPESYRRACRLIFKKFPSLNTRKKDSIKLIVLLIALFICTILVFPLFGFEITQLIILGIILVLLSSNKQPASKWTMVLCIYSVVGLSTMFGTNSAAEKEDYLIMSSTKNKNYIVIKTYQDKFIIAPVNLKRKEITPKFQFIEIKSDKDNKVEFTLVHTGKLKVKKVTGEQY